MQDIYTGEFTVYGPDDHMGAYIRKEISSYSLSQSSREHDFISGYYIERRKRKKHSFDISVNESLVILRGWDHPDVSRQYEDLDGDISGRRMLFYAFAVELTINFNTFIEAYLEDKPDILLFDGRGYPSPVVIPPTNPVPPDEPFQEPQGSMRDIPADTYEEGLRQTVVTSRYERSDAARRKCIAYYGTACYICGFDFGVVYGSIAHGFIHVHHIIPISTIKDTYEIDPVKDLRPICPNCHAVAHMTDPPYTVDEIRTFIQQHE